MRTYSGTFLVAFATLALEVTIVRLLSVVTYYHLSFFAISTALLGTTAGATLVYLRPDWFIDDKLERSIATACIGFSLSVPVTLMMLSVTPVVLLRTVMSLYILLQVTVIVSFPFFFSGVAITAILTKYRLPIGKLYASDLIGASLGALFVLGALELLDAPSVILLCSAIGALSGLVFVWNTSFVPLKRLSAVLFVAAVILSPINASTRFGIRPLVVKGEIVPPNTIFLEEWNSYSQVVVYERVIAHPANVGRSPVAPPAAIPQHLMRIDGDAATTVYRFDSTDDIEHLRYDVANVAYYLRPSGSALIIGVGGGKDVQSAILFGHERVVGVELNPIFVELLEDEFREFAAIADRDEITLVVDEGRSYVSRSDDQYEVIQMSLVDTWAATGAGAFSLSENALYTVEGWEVFLDHLADDGILTVARWYSPEDLGETGRLVSLATATLIESGVDDPLDHLALISSGQISTVLVSKQPFTNRDIAQLEQITSELEFEPIILPRVVPSHPALSKIVTSHSLSELEGIVSDEPLNYTPPTDENPYFFNMLRLNHLRYPTNSGGVIEGNLIATLTLLGLIVALLTVAVATIVVPLRIKTRANPMAEKWWAGALYFSLIGAGFMFVEIALIQRLSVFLSHPIYALGVLLFTIIASTGVGSFLSERLPLTHSPWVYVYPVLTAVVIIVLSFVLSRILLGMITSPVLTKIIVSVVVIFPVGMLLGLFFPTGMRLARLAGNVETPWYWALNGIFSVLCSALATFVAIYQGISINFYISAFCYLALLVGLHTMYRSSHSGQG
jgi:spermidine synthase